MYTCVKDTPMLVEKIRDMPIHVDLRLITFFFYEHATF